MAKIHFAYRERGNESNPFDEWSDTTACGLKCTESPLDDDWEYVTCKKCLKRQPINEKEDNNGQ